MKIISIDLTTVWKEKNTGPLIELSDFTIVTNQSTDLAMPTINT